MLIAILILTIFNTGLIFVIGIGGTGSILEAIRKATRHTDESIEAATTALYNKDSIKQKVEMSGRFEI